VLNIVKKGRQSEAEHVVERKSHVHVASVVIQRGEALEQGCVQELEFVPKPQKMNERN
jgi:hypothetical protein